MKNIIIIIFLLTLSCNQSKKKVQNLKEIIVLKDTTTSKLFDEKQKLISDFLDLFITGFGSVTSIENLFGEVGVEEEHFFFKECQVEHTFDYCFKAYDDYFKDSSKSESFIFKEIKKNKLVQELSIPENKILLLNSLNKINDYEYQGKLKSKHIKFLFRENERGTKILIRDFYIDNQSIFNGLFKN